jgi:hypothetical protein
LLQLKTGFVLVDFEKKICLSLFTATLLTLLSGSAHTFLTVRDSTAYLFVVVTPAQHGIKG